jgi:hypothetical protein
MDSSTAEQLRAEPARPFPAACLRRPDADEPTDRRARAHRPRQPSVSGDGSGPQLAAPFRLTIEAGEQLGDPQVLRMPAPLALCRQALPVVLEAVVGPLAVFYLVLVLAGFRGAMIAALGWSYAVMVRHVARGERVTTLLALGALLISVRTAVSFVTGSTLLYFAPPLVGDVVVAGVLLVSALLGRPVTMRFAEDFCPIDSELLDRPRVRQFFFRISLMWAAVLLVGAAVVLDMLLQSSSLRSFLLERTAITWALTAGAIACSVWGFTSMMRRDGLAVRWGEGGEQSATSLLAPRGLDGRSGEPALAETRGGALDERRPSHVIGLRKDRRWLTTTISSRATADASYREAASCDL